jgi:hypothetical protein
MSIRSRHRRQVLAAILAVGLLAAGCAQSSTDQGSASGGGSTASTGSTATTAAPPLTSAPSGPTSSAPSPPTTSPNGRAAVVVRGVVRKGVEPGCLLLDGQDKRYLLIDGPNAQLREGVRVEVRGQPVDQIASFCGEEAALAVVSVRPLR